MSQRPSDESAAVCVLDPEGSSGVAAAAAGLVISADCLPGISRTPALGGGFAYLHADGTTVSRTDRARIDALKIPPAWTDVWICADEHGHLQATGRDARGRKQYRYHDMWRAARDETKYGRLVAFGEALPKIRARVDEDMRRPHLDRSRVLALVVAILDDTLIRVGNPEYARDNDSFGLTTLRDEHAEVGATVVRLRFRGKAGKESVLSIHDTRIARALRRIRELPGQELFQYVDERGEQRVVTSGDVNDYLRGIAGESITSKDFRTWGGSLTAAVALLEPDPPPSDAAVTAAVGRAATVLGNTTAVCRRSYIHPGLIELYRSGDLPAAWRRAEDNEAPATHLTEVERAFLGVLRILPPAANGG